MLVGVYLDKGRVSDSPESAETYCSKTDDWHMMSRPTDVLNDSFVCYQDLSLYVGLENTYQGFHGEPALQDQ